MLPFVSIDESKIAPLQPFGLCCAVAFFVWDYVILKMSARRGFERSDFRVLTIYLGVLGWGFAWAVDALFYRAPGDPIGFSSTGGILGATVGAMLWTWVLHVRKEDGRWKISRRAKPHSLLAVSEVIVGTWPLAHAIGRMGCALVHDHIGKTVPPGTLGSLVAVGFPRSAEDGPHHVYLRGILHVFTGGSDVRYDLGLLECVILFGLAIAFARTWKKDVLMGDYTMIGALVYGSFRFLLDFLRADDVLGAEPRHAGLTFAQFWSLAVVALGIALLVRRMRRSRQTRQSRVAGIGAATAIALAVFATPKDAAAAERFIDRPMTLHRHVFAGDVGLGLGHVGTGPGSITGGGLNLEGAFGITESVEIGLRTGARFGDDGKITRADFYGRTNWTENYGVGGSTFANPELRVRWVFYTGSVAEVGLDGRLYVPFENGTNLGLLAGVPVAFHVTDILRIDTGAYVPLVFNDRTFNGISIPAYFWFQPADKFWVGPMAALRLLGNGGGPHDAHLLLGAGFGYQVANAVDLKAMLLFPTIDDSASRNWGIGIGAQFRIGD